MSIESLRQILEELDVLELAVAQRFRKNPSLRSAAGITEIDQVLESKPKRPHKETLLQQHELRFFAKEYEQNCARTASSLDSEAIQREVSALKDPSMTFEGLTSIIRNVDAKHGSGMPSNASSAIESYSMYLSAPADGQKQLKSKKKFKRKYFLSAVTSHIAGLLDTSFSESEMYGKYIDLTAFHEMYKSVAQSQLSYLEYLQTFAEFGSSRSADYHRYLEALLAHLVAFHEKIQPLRELIFPETTGEVEAEEDGKPNDKGEVYCKACAKLFTKESVYKGHLDGKKHKKNAKTVQNGNSEKKVSSEMTLKLLESKLSFVAQQLQPIIDATIADHSRRSTLSEREQALEVLAVQGEESEYTDIESGSENESSDDEMDYFSKDLPLGTDGIPIPLWLYKLQGLHKEYLCEICGNSTYKGRQQYTKHFSLPKHVHGLMCLGVAELDVPMFASISTIAEAQELWKTIVQNKKKEVDEFENAVEIEDEDGNVMTQKDYVELKRQGLL